MNTHRALPPLISSKLRFPRKHINDATQRQTIAATLLIREQNITHQNLAAPRSKRVKLGSPLISI